MAFGCAPIVSSTRVAQDSVGEGIVVGTGFMASVEVVCSGIGSVLRGGWRAPRKTFEQKELNLYAEKRKAQTKESIPTAIAMKSRACVKLSSGSLLDSRPTTGAIFQDLLEYYQCFS